MVPVPAVTGPLRSELLSQFSWLDHGFGVRGQGQWTPPANTARAKQTHSSLVVAVRVPGDHGEADALATSEPNLWLEIRTADCVPILLADPVHRAVTAVHAGWRGTAARIVKSAVHLLRERYGSNPAHLVAAIGPAIGRCCFEVGAEVAAVFPGDADWSSEKPHVDLLAANIHQIIGAGVPAGNIDLINRCTKCEPAYFESFRRDGGPGRMVSAISIR